MRFANALWLSVVSFWLFPSVVSAVWTHTPDHPVGTIYKMTRKNVDYFSIAPGSFFQLVYQWSEEDLKNYVNAQYGVNGRVVAWGPCRDTEHETSRTVWIHQFKCDWAYETKGWNGVWQRTNIDDAHDYQYDSLSNALPPLDDCDNSGPKALFGNPCDVSSGNKIQRETDYSAGDFVPRLTRVFNSKQASQLNLGDVPKTVKPLGPHWSHSQEAAVVIVPDDPSRQGDEFLLLVRNGRIRPFSNKTGSWQGNRLVRSSVSVSNGDVVHRLRDGSVERFSGDRLASKADRNGNLTQYAYDAAGNVSAVAGPFGHTLSFEYDAGGQLLRFIDPSGGITHYGYESGNLVQIRYPDNTTKLYHYEQPPFLTGITDENGSRFSTYSYDATGSVLSSEHAVTSNGAPQQKFSFSYSGTSSTLVTDPVGTQQSVSLASVQSSRLPSTIKNVADGAQRTFTYDEAGNVIRETDELGNVTSYTYNATDQRITKTDPLGRVEQTSYVAPDIDLPVSIESPSIFAGARKAVSITYDARYNPITVTQSGYTPSGTPVSRTVSFKYDAYGRVVEFNGPRTDVADVTTFEYYTCYNGGACGQTKRVTNALGHSVTYDAYDAHGRLLRSTDHNGVVTAYAYDLRGRVISQSQTAPYGAERLTRFRYDAAGQLIETVLPDGLVLTYTYDAAHDLRAIVDNLGNRVDYRYDLKGNRTGEYFTDPSGTLARSIEMSYNVRDYVSQVNDGGSITTMVNNAMGLLTKQTDPNGGSHTTDFSYDAVNRLIMSSRLYGHLFEYDINDRLKKVIPSGRTGTTYAYDDLGNLLQEVSPDRGTTTYTYDEAANLLTKVDALGNHAAYRYDALNRLIAVEYPNAPALNVRYVYDTDASCTFGIGRLCTMTDPAGTTEYSYDAFGNTASQARTEAGTRYITHMTHNAAGDIQGITYPDGREVTYNRDPRGRITAITATVNGTPTQILTDRTYRADDRLLSQTYGNGLYESRTYDLRGQLNTQTLGALANRHYTYDPNGNLTLWQDLTGSASYTYDIFDRLTKATENAKTYSYTYDNNGNRLSHTQGTTTSYTYTQSTNRLSKVGTQTHTLDAAGNTLSDNNGNRRFTYDPSGNLETATTTTQTRYTYDAHNRRTGKYGQTTTTLYHYDPQGRLLLETDPSGLALRTYILADDLPIAQIDRTPSGETLTYLHTDHLGTPRLATDPSGQTIWRWDGEAFGNTPPNEDPDGDGKATRINLRYAGQYYDAETGLFYNWNRYYDPRVGRYITSDPIGLEGGLNTYAYVRNNPLRFIDPTGTSDNTIIIPVPCGLCVIAPGTSGSNAANDDIYETSSRERPDRCDDNCELTRKKLEQNKIACQSMLTTSGDPGRNTRQYNICARSLNRQISAHNRECPRHHVKSLKEITGPTGPVR